MPIVVEGVSLEKYLVWLNEQLEGGADTIEGGITVDNLSSLGIMLLICNNIYKKVRLTNMYKLPLTNRYIFFSIIGLIIIFFPSIISVLSLDWLMDHFSYAYRIIFGDVVMCADLPGSTEPLDVKHANEFSPYPKEEMKEDVKLAGEIAINGIVLLGTMATAKTLTDLSTGDIPNATTSATVAFGTVVAGGVVKGGVNEICRKIDNIPDDHPRDEPVSPSAYESDTYSSIDIPFFRDLLEYIQGLDNETQMMYNILILIIIAIYIQLFKLYKDYMNKSINQLPYNNKYFNFLIKYKNIMNKYGNIYLNFLTGFFLFIAFLGILSLIFLF